MNRINSRSVLVNAMKTTPGSSISYRQTLWMSGLLLAMLVVVGINWLPSTAARANEPAPLIALLTPRDGVSLNAERLRVQALIAARSTKANETFVFNGQTVSGRNAGRVRRVELSLDGALLESVDTNAFGRQFVTDFNVDVSTLSDGLHLLTIKAVQGAGREEGVQSVSATFNVDRSLVKVETNRIEDAATPHPFAGFVVRAWDGIEMEEAGDDDEEPWHCPSRFDIKGIVELGSRSDGVDPSRDRFVVALGSQIEVLEPGSLRCNGPAGVNCRFVDESRPVLKSVDLKRKRNGRWSFHLRGRLLPQPPENLKLYLRIGNDTGGIDLATGERLVGLRPALDTAHPMQGLVGPLGGMVETCDAAGVHISLEIPPGALTRDTTITITPLASSPLAGGAAGLRPGVKLEPEGLRFAEAATLTFDFSATAQTITNQHSIFLLTSPMTELPLYGATDPATKILTARLHHFSEAQPGEGSNSLADLRAWADSVLRSTGNLTFAELEELAANLALAQRIGCADCIDPEALTQRVEASIAALVNTQCPIDTAAPTEAALRRYVQLEALAQSVGANVPTIRPCMRQLLQGLITRTGDATIADPSEANRASLVSLCRTAQALGFSDLETLALQKIDAAMRALAARVLARYAQAQNTTDEAIVREQSRTELQGALSFVTTIAAGGLPVPPALAQFLQSAINSLSSNEMVVTVNPSGPLPHYPSPFSWQISSGVTTMLATTAGTFTGPSDEILNQSRVGPSQGLPLSFSTHRGDTQMQSDLTQPRPNVLAWDVTTSTSGRDGNSFVTVYATLKFTKAGTLRIDVNPNWGSGLEWLNLDFYGDDALMSVLDATPTPPVFFTRCFGATDPAAPAPDCFTNVDQTTTTMTIPQPLTLWTQIRTGDRITNLADPLPASGAGRLLTFTFTPSP